jgi:tetratricopeptide (TPR) repeat protein
VSKIAPKTVRYFYLFIKKVNLWRKNMSAPIKRSLPVEFETAQENKMPRVESNSRRPLSEASSVEPNTSSVFQQNQQTRLANQERIDKLEIEISLIKENQYKLNGILQTISARLQVVLARLSHNVPKPITSVTNAPMVSAMQIVERDTSHPISSIQSIPIVPQACPVEVQLYLGESYLEQEEYSKAIEHLNKVSDSHPDFQTAQFYLGHAHCKLGKNSKAIEHLNKVSDSHPNFLDVQMYLGRIHLKLGEYSKAIEHLNKVSDSHLNFLDAQIYLGHAHSGLQEYAKAIEHLTQIPASDRNFAHAQEGLGLCYYLQKDFKKAIEHLNKVSDSSPNVQEGLGLCYFQQKEFTKSIEHFNKFLGLNPNHTNVHYFLGHAYFELKEYAKAMVYLTQVPVSDEHFVYTQELLKKYESGDLHNN